MPLGWYLAQGLYPLSPSSSDDEEGPCELPDGRIVCGPHGLVVCGKCCTDYSYMDDILSDEREEEDDDDEDGEYDVYGSDEDGSPGASGVPTSPGEEMRRGTGQVFPIMFTPPTSSITPTELFRGSEATGRLTRYVHRSDPKAVLVFTDGACLNNGKPDPKAGWAFVHGPGGPGLTAKPAVASARLESKGPFGDKAIQSSNRAELRAVIAVLRFRYWPGEGFNSMTIATDSEYVTEGSTKWAKTWIKNGWKTSAGADVKNKDLWEMLLGEAERWKDEGLTIRFWRIPREWNEIADAAAKKAAEKIEVPTQWVNYHGVCF